MKRGILTFALCACCMCGTLEAGTAGKIMKFKLKNEITVISKRTTSNRIVAIKLFVRPGVKNEPGDKAGICLLMQSLLMKGTKNKSQKQLSDIIEGVGGAISFGGNFDYLNGSLTVPEKYLNEAFKLFAEVIREPAFDEEEIIKQKEAQKNGLKARKDSIFTVADDAFRENIYGKHPYARIDTGAVDTIDSVTKNELSAIHSKYYSPENMLFVAVGDVKKSSVEKLIKKHFGDMKSSKSDFEGLNIKIESPDGEKRVELKKDFKQAYIMIGYLAPNVADADYKTLKVLNSVLGGRMSSRLFRELREKRGLAYEVSSFYPTRENESRFVIYMGLDEKNLELAEKGINEIILDIKNNDIGQKELDEVKRYVKGTYLMRHQSNDSQAWHLGWWEMLDKGYAYDMEYPREIDSVTISDIRNAANKYFTKDRIALIVVPADKNNQ